MHIRGNRLAIWAIITSLVFGVVGPVFTPQEVRSATSNSMPPSVKDFIAQDPARTKQAILNAGGTNQGINEFVQVMTGDNNAVGGIDAQVSKFVDNLLLGNIKEGMSIHKLNNQDWQSSYVNVYNSIYANVKNLDAAWDHFLGNDGGKGMNLLFDRKDDNYLLSSDNPKYQQFREDAQRTLDVVYDEILPYITMVYGGIQLLNAMNKNAELRTDVGDMADFDAMVKDLDIATREGGKVNTQSSRLYKRFNYADALNNEYKAGTADESSIYVSTTAFYNDVVRFANLLLVPPISSYTDKKSIITLQKSIFAAAEAMDKDTSNSKDITGGKSRFLRCGQASTGTFGFPNIGESITAALCSMVILIQDFSIATLEASLQMLGTVAGISDLAPSASSDEGFLTSLIPKEFTAAFLELSLSPQTNPSTDTEKAASTFYPILKTAHGVILNVVNVILILLFVFIALSNILQVQVNNYSVQKLFAPIVIGFVLATGSWFIIRTSVELASVTAGGILTQFRIGDGSKGDDAKNNFLNATKKVGSVGGDPTYELTETDASGEKRPSFSKVFQQGVLNGFTMAAAVIVFILAFLFMIRALVLAFLIPLSPVAFFASAIPALKGTWSKWSKPFFQWLIMPIIAGFWIWLAFVWLASVNISGAGTNAVQAIIAYLFGMVCFFAAIKSSLSSLSGEAKVAMDKWQGMGKKAWGATGGAALKASQKSVGRSAQTFAYNKNLLGVPGILERNKQREAIAKQQLENAQKKYGTRDNRNNRGRAVQLARLKTQGEIYDAKKEKMETQAKSDDQVYRQLQRGLGKLNSYQEELDGLMKKRIKLEKSYIDDAPGFLKGGKKTAVLKHAADDYHRLKADSLLMNEKIADKELNDFNEFEDFIDGKQVTTQAEMHVKKDEHGNDVIDANGKKVMESVMVTKKRVVDTKYLAGVGKDKDGKTTWTGNKVRAATNREAALKKQVEKKDEEGRMDEAARFSRASILMSRSKHAINSVEKGQAISEEDAKDLRGWLAHASNYYAEGVHADLGNEYKSVLAGLGESGEISAEQVEVAKASLQNINNDQKFEAAREVEIGLIKRVGQMDGEYTHKKATDYNKENDLEALKAYNTESFVSVLSGNVHELDPKAAAKAERAHLSNAMDLSSTTYEKRRVELIANQVKNLRDDAKTAGLNDKQVANAKEKTKLAEEKVKLQLQKEIDKITKVDAKSGKVTYNIGSSDAARSFWGSIGGPEKLQEVLAKSEGDPESFKLEEFLNQMAGADTSARTKFVSIWKNSKAADHLGMGPRVQGMPGDIRKGGAGKNVDEYPEDNSI
ncbi:hypothetical protein BH11PAT4_BH11PAT4_0880 [soil metagenome]